MKSKLFISLFLAISLFALNTKTAMAVDQCCTFDSDCGSPQETCTKSTPIGICTSARSCEAKVSTTPPAQTTTSPQSPPSCCRSNSECGSGYTCTGYNYLCSQTGMSSCVPGSTTSGGTCSGSGDSSCGPGLTCNYVGGNWFCMAPITRSDSKCIDTALGCISYDATGGGFVKSLLSIAIGLGGGIALLLILYGVFIVTTSSGIPEKLKSGNEIITSAVAGLLFIIMAIFMMNLIGIKILALPGLQ